MRAWKGYRKFAAGGLRWRWNPLLLAALGAWVGFRLALVAGFAPLGDVAAAMVGAIWMGATGGYLLWASRRVDERRSAGGGRPE